MAGLIQSIRDFFVAPQYYYEILPDVEWVFGLSPSELWKSQPHLRTVVNFGSAQVSQLGLHTFTRVSDENRQRDTAGLLPNVLRYPNPTTTTSELIRSLVGDLMLYDRAIWYVAESSQSRTGWVVQRIPVPWVQGVKGDAFSFSTYRITNPNGMGYTDLDSSQILEFHGYSPDSEREGSTPIYSLKEILVEQLSAVKYRNQVWKNGGRVSSVIERPAGVRWTTDQRESFKKDWRAKYTGDGTQAGGTPILEDGMKLVKMGSSEAEQQYVAASKLSLETVAQVYQINPTMIGINDQANYSNVREFRKMLYGDTLGPMLRMIEDRLNTFLLPMLGVDDEKIYLEFNIEEKLRGSFEEQAAATQSATGAPWMTRNEARAMRNMPSLPGGDELVTPLNVLIGGQASPNDSPGVAEGENASPLSFSRVQKAG